MMDNNQQFSYQAQPDPDQQFQYQAQPDPDQQFQYQAQPDPQPQFQYQSEPESQPKPEKKKGKAGLFIVIAIVVLVLLCCCCGGGFALFGGLRSAFDANGGSLLGLGQTPTVTPAPTEVDPTEEDPTQSEPESKDPYLAVNPEKPTESETTPGEPAVNLTSDGSIGQTKPFTKATPLADVVEEILPSVVCITINYEYSYNMMGQISTQNALASGSGVIISQDSDYIYIVTNNHVVTEEDSSSSNSYYFSANLESSKLTVTFSDDTIAEAEIRGTDNEKDLAVIAVKKEEVSKETSGIIKMATLGSSDDIRLGDQTIAIGNAMGFGTSVTSGIVSALHRDVTFSDGITRTLMQTDAAINPGNSGGGLFDQYGNLIAINSAKYADTDVEGIGYAIPISEVTDLILDLISFKPRTELSEDEQGFLGVSGQDIDSKLANYYDMPEGIYLTKIVEGSPAEDAGLLLYDVITAINGTKVNTRKGMTDLIKTYAAGETITVTYSRLEKGTYVSHDVEVTLSSRADYLAEQQRNESREQKTPGR